jgi:Trk-type K+ transport system membrane component
MQQSKSSIHSFRQIFFLYIGFIILFAFLLWIPQSNSTGFSIMDSLFLSTSALSVTGLTTIDVGTELTRMGQSILMVEMQLGGIGIVVLISYLFVVMDKKITVSSMLLLSKDQNQSKLSSITSLGISVLVIALLVETICFFILLGEIRPRFDDFWDAAFVSAFHAVASFTNSGFDLFGDSLISFKHNHLFLITTAITIFLGSLGYPTLVEYFLSFRRKKSLFTKINIRLHFLLLFIGMAIFFFLETNNTFSGLSIWEKLSNSLFFSATARNGGLTTIDVSQVTITTFLCLTLFMFIGGASSSTGGGIRLTTFAVLLSKVLSVAKSQKEVVIYKKTIAQEAVDKSFMVFFTFMALFFGSTILLTMLQTQPLEPLMFEVLSALTNTGLSFGITSELTPVSKSILIMLMIIGRIGVFSFIYTIFKVEKVKTRYLKEDLAVG